MYKLDIAEAKYLLCMRAKHRVLRKSSSLPCSAHAAEMILMKSSLSFQLRLLCYSEFLVQRSQVCFADILLTHVPKMASFLTIVFWEIVHTFLGRQLKMTCAASEGSFDQQPVIQAWVRDIASSVLEGLIVKCADPVVNATAQ